MRRQLDCLDTAEVDWSNPAPGIFSKILSVDAQTSARTSLTKVCPALGYTDQRTAHAHEQTEEIFVVDGVLSFDSRTWLHADGYVYHPAHYVHGFRSRVPGDAVFISRVSSTLSFRYFENPEDDYPYFIGSEPSTRPLAIVASPWTTAWAPLNGDRSIREFVYSQDVGGFERTSLRRYDAGSCDRVGGDVSAGYIEEFFVRSGHLEDQNGKSFKVHSFASIVAGGARPCFHAVEDSVVYHSVFRA